MRPPVDEARLRELASRLGRVAVAPTRIYLTGGASAVLEGWRGSTIPAIDAAAFRKKVVAALS